MHGLSKSSIIAYFVLVSDIATECEESEEIVSVAGGERIEMWRITFLEALRRHFCVIIEVLMMRADGVLDQHLAVYDETRKTYLVH